MAVYRGRFPAKPKEEGDWGIEDQFTDRSIYFSIKSANRSIANGRFVEWRVNYAPDDADLFPSLQAYVDVADVQSQSAYDASLVIAHSWGNNENYAIGGPFDYGNVVIFERLRIEGASRVESDHVWKLISKLIDREFVRRAAILVLKAFPLEYEGKVRASNAKAFGRRRAALVHLYQRRLALKTLPSKNGKEGWMYRLLRCQMSPAGVRITKKWK